MRRVDLRKTIDAVVNSVSKFFGITNKPVLTLLHFTVVIDFVEFEICAATLQLLNVGFV